VTSERDDYDVFLDTWEPGPILNYATLPPNLNDPMARLRHQERAVLPDDLGRQILGIARQHAEKRVWMQDTDQAPEITSFRIGRPIVEHRARNAGPPRFRRKSAPRTRASLWSLMKVSSRL
jgi:hypothetical protein